MKKQAERLDLTGVPCPLNAARALIKLASMPAGTLLEIVVDDGEPSANVPVSLEDEGCRVLGKVRKGHQWIFQVQRQSGG